MISASKSHTQTKPRKMVPLLLQPTKIMRQFHSLNLQNTLKKRNEMKMLNDNKSKRLSLYLMAAWQHRTYTSQNIANFKYLLILAYG